jgi:hypothetical protein
VTVLRSFNNTDTGSLHVEELVHYYFVIFRALCSSVGQYVCLLRKTYGELPEWVVA